MRNYEVTAIFRQEEDAFNRGKELIKQELARVGAQISKEEDLGVRDLAYDIKKQPKGHYYYFELSLDPARLVEVDKTFRLTAELLKYLFVKKEE
ncbi:MAG TPA: 30S ribosomal protein S6 [Spirochaetia bacterium]|nr:30S ribosomal protein S6 [Spirochaetia bacterium]